MNDKEVELAIGIYDNNEPDYLLDGYIKYIHNNCKYLNINDTLNIGLITVVLKEKIIDPDNGSIKFVGKVKGDSMAGFDKQDFLDAGFTSTHQE